MTKQALPKMGLDSILIYIAFASLIILAVMLMVGKFKETLSSKVCDTLYSRPTWYEETTTTNTIEASLISLNN